MPDDVSMNKAQIIEKCIRRIREEYQGNPDNLLNITRQDSIVLNMQRACEAAIALAMHQVAEKGLGVPDNSREAFSFLAEHGILEEELTNRLKSMVGFRNIAVHDYQKMNLDILQQIIETHLEDLFNFAQIMLEMN
ncbi:MAG: type VII toxin-antitoxin system HepT family RNase toxin [Syntrophomonadaceae bacterium]|jgi:uncharacterized protein YutE (UPF0331/DUF86 family)